MYVCVCVCVQVRLHADVCTRTRFGCVSLCAAMCAKINRNICDVYTSVHIQFVSALHKTI